MSSIFLFLLGLGALIAGAELMTRAGSRLAAQLGVPPMLIGLTLVALGTSIPELAIGIQAALAGAGSLTVGNIAGTNTVNILLILGMSALLKPLLLDVHTVRLGLSVMIAAALALLWMAWDGALSRASGAVMVAGAVCYTALIVRWARREGFAAQSDYARKYAVESSIPVRRRALDLSVLITGIIATVLGAHWLVGAAVSIAAALGVSDAVIGLTIVAIGTSAPELVTTIVGTLHNNRDIAIGNLLGSSTYNILAILGITCLIPPMGLEFDLELVRVDIPVMTAVALVCVPVFLTGRRISRIEGASFVSAYFVYLGYLLVART